MQTYTLRRNQGGHQRIFIQRKRKDKVQGKRLQKGAWVLKGIMETEVQTVEQVVFHLKKIKKFILS